MRIAFPYIKGQGEAANKINKALSAKNLIGETIEEIKAIFRRM
jgi:hypothetical protein